MECTYCKNTFKSKSGLRNHQKTARYCLVIQNKDNEINEKYKCEGCGKSYSTPFSFGRHKNNCLSIKYNKQYEEKINKLLNKNTQYITQIDMLESILIEKDRQIKELADRLENVAIRATERPTVSTTTNNKTTINNIIQNLQPVSDRVMIENVPNLTIDHIKKGPSGYAEYALEFPLKDRILCTDFARRKIKYKDMEGNVITDPEMANLSKKFFSSIREKNSELIIKYGEEFKEKFGEHMGALVNIYGYKMNVNESSEGNKPDFLHDFIKHVCSQTIKDE